MKGQDDNGPLDEAARKMVSRVGRAGRRKEEYRRVGDRSFWSSLAFIGMVGWGVMLPAIAGGFLGAWIDRKSGTSPTWTLALLLLGLALGCANAWRVINQERD